MISGSERLTPYLPALCAAVLFGASAPLSKVLLESSAPVTLASLLYLGSGAGLFLVILLVRGRETGDPKDPPLTLLDIPWLAGAIVTGGVAAPIVLLWGLSSTPAATASLLLNFEAVATTILALILFREATGGRVWAALGLITLASVLLSWNFGGEWGFSAGAAGILAACCLWGLDNNLTRVISHCDPFQTAAIKGLCAGSFSFLLALLLREIVPPPVTIIAALIIGFFSYGLSVVLFIHSLRTLGTARTGIFFGTAPFFGVLLSVLIFQELPSPVFVIVLPLMAFGTWILLGERHMHPHVHLSMIHTHRHRHDDGHHDHIHEGVVLGEEEVHSHPHTHEGRVHTHIHTPDMHHTHGHEK